MRAPEIVFPSIMAYDDGSGTTNSEPFSMTPPDEVKPNRMLSMSLTLFPVNPENVNVMLFRTSGMLLSPEIVRSVPGAIIA